LRKSLKKRILPSKNPPRKRRDRRKRLKRGLKKYKIKKKVRISVLLIKIRKSMELTWMPQQLKRPIIVEKKDFLGR
jgi:hypothetical protein